MSERLNKYLAFHLGVSRREADNLIAAGKVTIDAMPAPLGARVEDGQIIAVNEKVIDKKKDFTYLLMNKPAGYVSSRKQQGDHPTLYSLLPKEFQTLKTVGRLDKDSSGLLLLTDNGDFAYEMTHPKFYKVKKYIVELNKTLEPLHQQMISDFGVTLEDGPSKLSLARLDAGRKSWEVTMHEGRNRQIRRTFAALGYDVTSLHRFSFGPYTLGDIEPGAYETVGKY